MIEADRKDPSPLSVPRIPPPSEGPNFFLDLWTASSESILYPYLFAAPLPGGVLPLEGLRQNEM